MSALSPLTSPLLALPGIAHGFFTRQGGVSTGQYAALNCGPGSADDPASVAENRSRVAHHFGQSADALLNGYQIHSATAALATHAWGEARPQADGVVSATPGLVCAALAADCAPILLADPQARIVAAAHAGWKGALTGIVEATLAAMVAHGAQPDRIVAVVGPCIGPASYEVGLEFRDRFLAGDPAHQLHFQPGVTSDKAMFDLPGFVLARLAASGVTKAAWTGHDTCTNEVLCFSNRRAFKRGEDDFGRMISAIMLV